MSRYFVLLVTCLYSCFVLSQNSSGVYGSQEPIRINLSETIRKQENLNVRHNNAKKRSVQKSNKDRDASLLEEAREFIEIDYSNNKKIFNDAFFELLFSSTGVKVDNKKVLRDKNGFKDIVFTKFKNDFYPLENVDDVNYNYKSNISGNYYVFNTKMDNIFLSFGNENKLDAILLFKGFNVYNNEANAKLASSDFKSIVENYRSLLGRESDSRSLDSGEESFVWEVDDIRLIVQGGMDKDMFIKNDFGLEIRPYMTIKVYYIKIKDLSSGV